MAKSRLPNYGDLAGLYLNGMTQNEIMQMYKVDTPPMCVRSQKHETKTKITHFFKVIEGSKRAYIEHPRARINRKGLLTYASKNTLVSTTSIMRVLEALEKHGWSLQEATQNMRFLDRAPEKKRLIPFNR